MKQELDLREVIESIFRLIPGLTGFHSRENELYILLNTIVKTYFKNYKQEILDVAPLDGMVWPHISLGNLTSYDFFLLDELILHSFYWINRNRYRTAFDFGANVGIDSIILSRFGYEVYSFEPDPLFYKILVKNVSINQCKNIHTYQNAVSGSSGVVNFVRVKDNTTASHILGARDSYGEVDHLKVETITFQDIDVNPDLVKINVEGHEKNVVSSIDCNDWENFDAFIEIHNQENSEGIFNYFLGSCINIFSQKLGWQQVAKIEEMPMDNKEGYIFVSKKQEMPWQTSSPG